MEDEVGDPEAILTMYRETCEEVENAPRRRPGDEAAARELAALDPDADNGIEWVAEWAVRDEYTRDRLRSRGLRHLAEHFEVIAARASQDPDRPVIECERCDCRFPLDPATGDGAMCPRCCAELGVGQFWRRRRTAA